MTIDWNARHQAVIELLGDIAMWSGNDKLISKAFDVAYQAIPEPTEKPAPQYPVELVEALRRAEMKLTAYVGVCSGDKELTEAVLPMVRKALADLPKPVDPDEELITQVLGDHGGFDARTETMLRDAIKRIRTQTQDASDGKGS